MSPIARRQTPSRDTGGSPPGPDSGKTPDASAKEGLISEQDLIHAARENNSTLTEMQNFYTPEVKKSILALLLEQVDLRTDAGRRMQEKENDPSVAVEARAMGNVIGPSAAGPLYQIPASLIDGKIIDGDEIGRMRIYEYLKKYFGVDLAEDAERDSKLRKYTNLLEGVPLTQTQKVDASSPASTPDTTPAPNPMDRLSDPDFKVAYDELVKWPSFNQDQVGVMLAIEQDEAGAMLAEMEVRGIIGPKGVDGKYHVLDQSSSTSENIEAREQILLARHLDNAIDFVLGEGRPVIARLLQFLNIKREELSPILAKMESMGIISSPKANGSRDLLVDEWPPASSADTAPTRNALDTASIRKLTRYGFNSSDIQDIKSEDLLILLDACSHINAIYLITNNNNDISRLLKWDEADELPKTIGGFGVERLLENAKALETRLAELNTPTPDTDTADTTSTTPDTSTTTPSPDAGGDGSTTASTPDTSTTTSTTPDTGSDASTPDSEPDAPDTEPDAPDAEPAKKGIFATFRGAFDRFVSKFKGEVQPEDEADHNKELSDYAKKGALVTIGAYASLIGYKGFHDFPAWLVQKYTTRKEKKQIDKERKEREAQIEAEGGSDVLDKKKAMLAEVIGNSKFLTKEKKEELIEKVNEIVTSFEIEDMRLRGDRDEKIAKLLDEAIQTRIKTATALKEGINSALMVSGLITLRAGVYGIASLAERYQKVSSEIESKERTGGFVNEFVLKGFTETASKLAGGVTAFPKAVVYGTGAAFEFMRSKVSKEKSEDLDTYLAKLKAEAPKALRAVEGAATIMRLAGFGGMAMAEILETGGPSAMFDAALSSFEEKGVGQAVMDNIIASPMKPIDSIGKIIDNVSSSEGIHIESPATSSSEIPSSGVGDSMGETDITPDNAGMIVTADSSDAISGEPLSSTGEVVGTVSADARIEYTAEEVKLGTVQKGNGIIDILKRQGLSTKEALEAAQEAKIVHEGGDLRLTTKAIGRLSVLAHTSPEGEVTIGFLDTQSGDELTLDEARAQGFTYESGAPSGAIDAPAGSVEAPPEVATPESASFADSPAPNDLLGDTFHIYTDAAGNLSGIDAGGSDTAKQITLAINELTAGGHDSSPEADYLRSQLNILEASKMSSPSGAVEAVISSGPEPAPLSTEAHEALEKFKGDAGRVRFTYNEDGSIHHASLRLRRIGVKNIRESLADWGLDTEKVEQYYQKNNGGTWNQNAANQYRDFTRETVLLDRHQATVEEMKEAGLTGTPEYAFWKKEVADLESELNKKMDRNFNIKNKPPKLT